MILDKTIILNFNNLHKLFSSKDKEEDMKISHEDTLCRNGELSLRKKVKTYGYIK